MTPPPAETPAYVWLLAIVIPAVTTALAAVAVAVINRPVRKALRSIQGQTENEHAETEYPNLRDELTATREAAEKAATATERLEREQREQRRDIGGLRADHRQTRDDLGHLREVVDGNAGEARLQHNALARRLEKHLNPDT